MDYNVKVKYYENINMGTILCQWPLVGEALSTFDPLWPVFIYTGLHVNNTFNLKLPGVNLTYK